MDRVRGRHGAQPMLALLIFTAAAAWLHLRTPLLVDEDTAYHFRHAALYAERGLMMTEFPWLSASVITRHAADLWYGFHLLLIPFTLAPDPGLGMKLAGIAVLGGSLFAIYAACRKMELAWPLLWPLLVLFCAAPAMLRMVAVRPHVLSMGLGARQCLVRRCHGVRDRLHPPESRVARAAHGGGGGGG